MKHHVFTLAVSGLLALAASAPNAAALDDTSGQALLKKGTCSACHGVDKKGVGPSFKDVAARRKGQADAVAALEKVIRSGSKGVYGTIAMPSIPASKLTDPEVHSLAEWILGK